MGMVNGRPIYEDGLLLGLPQYIDVFLVNNGCRAFDAASRWWMLHQETV